MDRIACETDRLRSESVLRSAMRTRSRSSAWLEAADVAGAIGIRAAADRVLMVIGITEQGRARLRHRRAKVLASLSTAAIRAGVLSRVPARRSVRRRTSPRAPSRRWSPGSPRRISSDSRQVHISGCAKGCARAGSAALTIVGSPDGCALVANGSARDTPFTVIATNELSAAIDRHFRATAPEDSHV